MNKIFTKLRNVILNRIKGFKQDHKFRRQAKNTVELRKKKTTDYDRWSKPQELYEDWNERTAILGVFINQGAKVIEFGAGNMALKRFLPPSCSYTPSDIYKRNEEILVCDLNHLIKLDLSKYDTAVFSGVLEYVYDIDEVFRQLENSVKNVVLSYACSDISNANRLKRGWLSDYEKMELESVFWKYNYEISNYKEWKNQSIYSLEYKNQRE
jgi:hypothetical protein